MNEKSSLRISNDRLQPTTSTEYLSEGLSTEDHSHRDSTTDLLQTIDKAAEKVRSANLTSISEKVTVQDEKKKNPTDREKLDKKSIDSVVPETEFHDVETPPAIALTATQIAIHHIQTPGAVRIRPPGRVSVSIHEVEDVTENSEKNDFEQGVLNGADSPETPLEATLVVNQESEVIVKPAVVAEAEPLDEDLLKRLRQNENESDTKRRRKYFLYLGIPVIVCLLVVVIIVLVLLLREETSDTIENASQMDKNYDDPDDPPDIQGSNGLMPEAPYNGTRSIRDFQRITQHAVVFDIKTDCLEMINANVPHILMRLQCYNPNGLKGGEAIALEKTSANVQCVRKRVNNLECNATIDNTTISGNSSRFFTAFTCGTFFTNTTDTINASTALFRSYPLTGISCAKEAVVTTTMARLCADSPTDRRWTLKPAINKCLINDFVMIDDWPFCRASDSCDAASCPSKNLTVPEISMMDDILNATCENRHGGYSPIDTSFWGQDISNNILWNLTQP
jgi:ribosomal protein L12E/L44/L45/RPP1/RPP2